MLGCVKYLFLECVVDVWMHKMILAQGLRGEYGTVRYLDCPRVSKCKTYIKLKKKARVDRCVYQRGDYNIVNYVRLWTMVRKLLWALGCTFCNIIICVFLCCRALSAQADRPKSPRHYSHGSLVIPQSLGCLVRLLQQAKAVIAGDFVSVLAA